MKVETLQDLIEWTRQTHKHLGQCLARAGKKQDETRAQWLLHYLADHEKRLVKVVDRFEKEADPKALHTWVYDYVARTPIEPQKTCPIPYESMSLDEIAASVLDTHNQIIDLYRYLMGRADIPEARQLVEDLQSLEEHEAMLLAQQYNRLSDV